MSTYLPHYFSSEWSIVHYKLPDNLSICAFNSDDQSISGKAPPPPLTARVISAAGVVYRLEFDLKGGGACNLRSQENFL
jgi:hypothetical protein